MRHLFFRLYRVRITFSKYIWERTRCKCNFCGQTYFLNGHRRDLDEGKGLNLAINSNKKEICFCGLKYLRQKLCFSKILNELTSNDKKYSLFASVYMFKLGTLELDSITMTTVFDPRKQKYFGKYGDVYRSLIFNQYGTRVALINSYAGKHKTAIHFKCYACNQLYKFAARSNALFNRNDMEYALMSNKSNFCQCSKMH